MSSETDETGPIDYLVIEFPGSRMTGEGLPLLVDLVDRGIIRILDLVFVRKNQDGTVDGVELSELTTNGHEDLAVFEGVSSGLLGRDDIDEVSAVLEAGSAAAIVIYENVWAGPLAAALRRSGGRLVANGRIPVQEILASLDAAEAGAQA
ncbi:DUF6325 family protein [Streptomyces sp. NPDC001880]